MDELLAFWRARLDETEWIAQGAARTDDGHGGKWLPVHFGAAGFDARVDDHIALHDPDRALRDVAADRAILAEYVAVRKLQGLTGTKKDGYRDWILRQRVAVYSDHPSYKEDWKP